MAALIYAAKGLPFASAAILRSSMGVLGPKLQDAQNLGMGLGRSIPDSILRTTQKQVRCFFTCICSKELRKFPK